MSEETYRQVEEIEETPQMNLNILEKQPRDLGIHKVVFGPGQTADFGSKEALGESITVVQDEYSNWEKNDSEKNKCVRQRVVIASILCIVFIGFEFAGGFLSNSLVIAADAAQMLTVFSTLMVSMFALQVSNCRPQNKVTWWRLEVMTALFSILTTWVLTSIVLYLAFERIVKGDFVIDVDMMLATSAFGVVANLVMGMTLHNFCHVKYPAGCGADPNTSVVNINVRSAFLHVVCDFLFSLAVFVTALFIDCCPDWHIVDPISTFVFSILVLYITLAILRDLLDVLVQGMPKGVYFNDVLKTLLTIEGVQQVQNLRLWALSLDKIALSAHLTIRPGVDHNEVLKIASRRVHAQYNFFEMTIHIEVTQNLPTELSLPPTKKNGLENCPQENP